MYIAAMRIRSILTKYRCPVSFVNMISMYNTSKFDKKVVGPDIASNSSRPRSDTCSRVCKTTHINKRRSNISASRDLSEFLKLIFKRQTMLELFFSGA